MRIIITNLIGDISRPQSCHPQQFLRFIDANIGQVFLEGMPGFLAEHNAKMAGAEVYQGCHFIEGKVRVAIMLFDKLVCLKDQIFLLAFRLAVPIGQC